MKKLSSLLVASACLVFGAATTTHAKNVILTGVIEAQIVCHDGGNRGASPQMLLSQHDDFYYGDIWSLYETGHKHYYARTTCFDLTEIEGEADTHGVFNGKIQENKTIYAWWNVSGRPVVCKNFSIKFVKNGEEVWVQNGGSTIYNVTCVAKDGI